MALPRLRDLTPRLVQLVHRHGDRTPITTLEPHRAFWRAQLPSAEQLARARAGTSVLEERFHAQAACGFDVFGRDDVFGQLTARGLMQMRERGLECRQTLLGAGGAPASVLEVGDVAGVAVACTAFSRTLASVQGLLRGLLLDHLPAGGAEVRTLPISTSGHSLMIPDPTRRPAGQAEAEVEVWSCPEVIAREASMAPLRERIVGVLEAEGLLGPPPSSPSTAGSPQPSWGRLAEILNCMRAYGRLPAAVSEEDVEAIVGHGAWRWFALLSPRFNVAHTATAPFARALLDACDGGGGGGGGNPAIRILSCHDSTLIGVLQALGLEDDTWPSYGSVLQLQLLEGGAAGGYLRATLNGATLRWRHDALAPDGVVALDAVRSEVETTFPTVASGFEQLWGYTV